MPVSELDADKNPVKGYILGNEYISQVNGTSFAYYLNDEQQGSVRYLTGSDGSIRNHYRYSAFGETITAEETVPNSLRYNGQMADGLTGLYYLRARYYNASLGRFTQEDVIYNDGLNLYAYCNSNPVMYSDPSGFAKQCDPKVGGEKDSKSGTPSSKIDYKEVFFKEHPELRGEVWVHHGVEQQVLTKPQTKGLFSYEEMHSLDNLRGIPKEINSDLHLSKIRKEWNKFYKEFPNPTKEQLLQNRKDYV